jgi:nucleoside-diphosphate-sugar epimerase
MSAPLHLVVGSGAIGAGVAALLVDRGERVRVVTRSGRGLEHPLAERVAADATDAEQLARLADGAAAIYNCANPPYHRWATDWPPLAAAMLDAATRTGAVLVTMSNLYGYGPCPMPMTEQTPLDATSVKGRVRARMWTDALAAHRAGQVRATEVRASDYLGVSDQSYMHDRVVPALLAGKTARVLGDPDAPHTWTWTGDIARLLVTVAQDARAWGRAWHTPSPEAVTSRALVSELCRVAGVRSVPVKPLPWWLIRALGTFSPLLRELPEVGYQHDRPFVMDSTAARTTFGLEPTAWEEILLDTLSHEPREPRVSGKRP